MQNDSSWMDCSGHLVQTFSMAVLQTMLQNHSGRFLNTQKPGPTIGDASSICLWQGLLYFIKRCPLKGNSLVNLEDIRGMIHHFKICQIKEKIMHLILLFIYQCFRKLKCYLGTISLYTSIAASK